MVPIAQISEIYVSDDCNTQGAHRGCCVQCWPLQGVVLHGTSQLYHHIRNYYPSNSKNEDGNGNGNFQKKNHRNFKTVLANHWE